MCTYSAFKDVYSAIAMYSMCLPPGSLLGVELLQERIDLNDEWRMRREELGLLVNMLVGMIL